MLWPAAPPEAARQNGAAPADLSKLSSVTLFGRLDLTDGRIKSMKETKKTETEGTDPRNPHKPKIEDEKPGQSAVGKHSPTQREQNEERDQRAVR
jgi:hypothetical protein